MQAPEYPWHDHDGSKKCPVPKRRRGGLIEVKFRYGETHADNNCTGWTWDWSLQSSAPSRNIVSWRYTQPDPGKSRKWGPWKCDIAEWDRETGPVQCEYHGGKYIRHRVRL